MGDRRPNTRSQGYLGIPAALGFGRGRSPSPSPTDRPRSPVFFPPETMAPTGEQQNMPFDMAEIHRIAAAAAAEAAAAAVAAALAAQADRMQPVITEVQRKRPDLPKFDPKNIEIWIRRMEAAYCRAAVTTPKDKFAFLESLFDVGLNPKIDAFLYGDATDAQWTAFLAYLRKEYGRTQQQKAAAVLDGITRDGRRPTQLLAFIDNQLDDVSIDDIKKMLLRQLPREVRHALSEQARTATAAQIAEKADNYFHRDGRPANADSATAPVNLIGDDLPASDEAEINAALGRQPRRQSTNPARQSARSSSNPDTRSRPTNSRSKSRPHLYDGECFYHHKFKDQARRCMPGCKREENSNANSGNGQAGRRT